MRLPVDHARRHHRQGQRHLPHLDRLTSERPRRAERFVDLLTAGGRIYHETHYAPMLQMHGTVREVALDIVGADGAACRRW